MPKSNNLSWISFVLAIGSPLSYPNIEIQQGSSNTATGSAVLQQYIDVNATGMPSSTIQQYNYNAAATPVEALQPKISLSAKQWEDMNSLLRNITVQEYQEVARSLQGSSPESPTLAPGPSRSPQGSSSKSPTLTPGWSCLPQGSPPKFPTSASEASRSPQGFAPVSPTSAAEWSRSPQGSPPEFPTWASRASRSPQGSAPESPTSAAEWSWSPQVSSLEFSTSASEASRSPQGSSSKSPTLAPGPSRLLQGSPYVTPTRKLDSKHNRKRKRSSIHQRQRGLNTEQKGSSTITTGPITRTRSRCLLNTPAETEKYY